MRGDIQKILISQDQIARRVRELAVQITADHAAPPIQGAGQITIVPILTGAMLFCADLIRHLPMRMRISLLAVSSYPGPSTQPQQLQVLFREVEDLQQQHVLIIDDILDSGSTLRLVQGMLAKLGPASLKTCVLLRKNTAGAQQTRVDYVGFDIPDEFVVGYGLDYDDYYRNLPDVGTLKPEVIAARVKEATR